LCHAPSRRKQPESKHIKALQIRAKISMAQKWHKNSRHDQGIFVAQNENQENMAHLARLKGGYYFRSGLGRTVNAILINLINGLSIIKG